MSGYIRVRQQQLMREAEGYIDLAMCLSGRWTLGDDLKCKMSRRAIRILSQVDTKRLNCPRILYFQGQAYRLAKRYEDAIPPLQRANELDPVNVHINLTLGWCYKRINRIDRAISILEEAIEVKRDSSILHYNLACYWSLNNHVGLTLTHLARSFLLNSDYRYMVADEPDFDTVRNHPEFLALTAVSV